MYSKSQNPGKNNPPNIFSECDVLRISPAKLCARRSALTSNVDTLYSHLVPQKSIHVLDSCVHTFRDIIVEMAQAQSEILVSWMNMTRHNHVRHTRVDTFVRKPHSRIQATQSLRCDLTCPIRKV